MGNETKEDKDAAKPAAAGATTAVARGEAAAHAGSIPDHGPPPPESVSELQAMLWEDFLDLILEVETTERVALHVARTWASVGYWTTVLTAATAGSSTLAGIAAWQTTWGKILWGILTGCAAISSVLLAGVDLGKRVKTHSDVHGHAREIRRRLERFQKRNIRKRVTPEANAEERLAALDDAFAALDTEPIDLLRTQSLVDTIREEVVADYQRRKWLSQ